MKRVHQSSTNDISYKFSHNSRITFLTDLKKKKEKKKTSLLKLLIFIFFFFFNLSKKIFEISTYSRSYYHLLEIKG